MLEFCILRAVSSHLLLQLFIVLREYICPLDETDHHDSRNSLVKEGGYLDCMPMNERLFACPKHARP